METVYTRLKVNNEIELCEFEDLSFKDLLERELLRQRVSYFMKWSHPGWFKSNKKSTCILCVNENQCEQVEEMIKKLEEKNPDKVRFLKRKPEKSFF